MRIGAILISAMVLSACASSTDTPAPAAAPAQVTSSSAGGALDDLDPQDAAFVAQLRSQGLIPAEQRADFPDAAYITDASAVCKIIAIPGESAAVIKTDLSNMRKNRVAGYGITQDQATQVMILSAQTYCPSALSTVKSALS